jgi:hypothetical protein
MDPLPSPIGSPLLSPIGLGLDTLGLGSLWEIVKRFEAVEDGGPALRVLNLGARRSVPGVSYSDVHPADRGSEI